MTPLFIAPYHSCSIPGLLQPILQFTQGFQVKIFLLFHQLLGPFPSVLTAPINTDISPWAQNLEPPRKLSHQSQECPGHPTKERQQYHQGTRTAQQSNPFDTCQQTLGKKKNEQIRIEVSQLWNWNVISNQWHDRPNKATVCLLTTLQNLFRLHYYTYS